MYRSPIRAGFILLVVVLALWLCSGFTTPPAATSNDVLVQQSFQQFDQSLDTGWRVLQVQRDYRGAAKTILDYMSAHSTTLEPWQKASLAFHLGHVYALMDDRADAIHWFKKSLSYHAMGNPAYVEGFIAFLQNDKKSLLADRHSVASNDPGPWQLQDLHEMDAMIEYFGAPFEAAWGALNCINMAAKADPHWPGFCRAMADKYHDIYLQHTAAMRSR